MGDDRDMSRIRTCIFDALEQLHHAMIVKQNTLFAYRQEINKQAKLCSSKLVASCRQAKETLQLNLAMLERVNCKVTRFSFQEMVTRIVDNFCDLMRNTEFPTLNTNEKIFFSELLVTVSRNRDDGLNIDFDCFLDQICMYSSKMMAPT